MKVLTPALQDTGQHATIPEKRSIPRHTRQSIRSLANIGGHAMVYEMMFHCWLSASRTIRRLEEYQIAAFPRMIQKRGDVVFPVHPSPDSLHSFAKGNGNPTSAPFSSSFAASKNTVQAKPKISTGSFLAQRLFCLPSQDQKTCSSTLRFWARPASVSLVATGCFFP